jgi:hypothetical protein
LYIDKNILSSPIEPTSSETITPPETQQVGHHDSDPDHRKPSTPDNLGLDHDLDHASGRGRARSRPANRDPTVLAEDGLDPKQTVGDGPDPEHTAGIRQLWPRMGQNPYIWPGSSRSGWDDDATGLLE